MFFAWQEKPRVRDGAHSPDGSNECKICRHVQQWPAVSGCTTAGLLLLLTQRSLTFGKAVLWIAAFWTPTFPKVTSSRIKLLQSADDVSLSFNQHVGNRGLGSQNTARGVITTWFRINGTKTKIQVFDEDISQPSKVPVLGHDVEVVDSFVYLGSCIDIAGGSETDKYSVKEFSPKILQLYII